MRSKELSQQLSVGIIMGVMLTIVFSIVIPRLAFLNKYLPVAYYNTLPVSNTGDIDRDGIPDTIDDSDGDSIADAYDATPLPK
ncbi:hypothetical protein HN512_04215 [Candidatus Peregrinibacteria bacterium]|jgi:hypothetical protein|nr:hypothetical protein [Candidatus Peregrinibacteria bacterium]MBT3599014.1 hypothetical protein [Candidatus Peregrinibacteria bacterium]MBT6730728.1 hypothetical protein [Candidatus Peregrinibacteria bacterium]MBT7008814.1 hypothetical protein [Candidatus Peregrinibacteria bacterium]